MLNQTEFYIQVVRVAVTPPSVGFINVIISNLWRNALQSFQVVGFGLTDSSILAY